MLESQLDQLGGYVSLNLLPRGCVCMYIELKKVCYIYIVTDAHQSPKLTYMDIMKEFIACKLHSQSQVGV
jgi:hypothetical protein